MSKLILPLLPEGAIIRTADASVPTKRRVQGTNHPKVVLDYETGLTQKATWRLPLPKQNEVGAFASDDVTVVLKFSTDGTGTGNVQFRVHYALIEDEQSYDKAFDGTQDGAVVAIAGSSNGKELSDTITLSGILSGLDVTKNYTLVILVERRVPSSDFAETVYLLNSHILFTQTREGWLNTLLTFNTSGSLLANELDQNLILGDTSSGAVDLTLPALTATSNFIQFTVVRKGLNLLRLLTSSVAYHIVYGGYVTDQILEFTSNGDSAQIVYEHSTQTFYVIG